VLLWREVSLTHLKEKSKGWLCDGEQYQANLFRIRSA